MDVATLFAQFKKQQIDDLPAAILTLASILAQNRTVSKDEPLTVAQAAKMLGVSSLTSYDLCQKGEVVCHRIGTDAGRSESWRKMLRRIGGRQMSSRLRPGC